MLIYVIIGVFITTIALVAFRRLHPRPYPGIPYNAASANRIAGDIPNLIPVVRETNEFSHSIFTVTTQELGSPIAQFLFPGIRKPLIILEDPREVEDILVRRNKEFDKAPMVIDVLSPMFPKGSISQYTTPELRLQKRVWADVMNAEFLRKAVAPNIHKATLELLTLWRLKATTVYKNQPFNVLDDLKNAALDVIWVAVVGDEPGITRYEIEKIKRQLKGDQRGIEDQKLPRGIFIKAEVIYVTEAIARNSNTPVPKWAQKLETYTSRYRRFKSIITAEISTAMKNAVDRFQRIQTRGFDTSDADTCMMDLVLRRRIIEAKRAGRLPSDPVKDQNLLDEMFVMLVAVSESMSHL